MRIAGATLTAAALIAAAILAFVCGGRDESAGSRDAPVATPSDRVTRLLALEPSGAEVTQSSRFETAAVELQHAPGAIPGSTKSSRELDADYLDHPAISAMSEFYGEDPALLVMEVSKVWPGLLEGDVAPLRDWADVEPVIADLYRDSTIGAQGPPRMEVLVGEVLGSNLDDYLKSAVAGAMISRERADELTPRFREILDDAALTYEELALEWDNVIRTKVQQGKYDRWPYVTLMGRRHHFLSGQGRLLSASCMAHAESCWVVGISVYEGEFPPYDAARARWEAARDDSRKQIEQLVKGS